MTHRCAICKANLITSEHDGNYWVALCECQDKGSKALYCAICGESLVMVNVDHACPCRECDANLGVALAKVEKLKGYPDFPEHVRRAGI